MLHRPPRLIYIWWGHGSCRSGWDLLPAVWVWMQEAVDDVISHMDAYYLSHKDWDTVVELSVDGYKDDLVLKIASGEKSALMRRSGQLIVNAKCVS